MYLSMSICICIVYLYLYIHSTPSRISSQLTQYACTYNIYIYVCMNIRKCMYLCPYVYVYSMYMYLSIALHHFINSTDHSHPMCRYEALRIYNASSRTSAHL